MENIQSAVYTGVWTNWSRGQVLGQTLTIPQSQGYLLVAFLGLFVKFAGDQLWQILQFVLHQQRSSGEPQDGLHYQIQAILRNSPMGIGIPWKFAQLVRAWYPKSHQALRRTLPYAAYCLFHVAAIGAAGLFSSRVVSVNDAALVRSPSCGWMAEPVGDYNLLQNQSDRIQFETYVSLLSSYHRSIKSSAEYARICYDGTSTANTMCQQYSSSRLEPKINFTATCPFTEELCLGDAVHIDTGYIDSHGDLGINGQPGDRIQFRKQMTCAPIDMEGRLSTDWTTIPGLLPNDSIREYHLGWNRHPVNGSLLPSNITKDLHKYSLMFQSTPYGLWSDVDFAGNDSTGDFLSTFWIIPELRRTHTDYTALELVSVVEYIQKTEDLWYSATTQENLLWQTDHPASVVVCAEQYSYCNTSHCTDNSGFYEIMPTAERSGLVAMNNAQWATFELVWKAAQLSNVYCITAFLGNEILLAQDLLMDSAIFVSPGLPSDQWKHEIKNMHAMTMAILQQRVVEYASPPDWVLGPGQRTTDFLIKPNTSPSQNLCENIQIRASNISAFSVIGIFGILAAGAVLTILNFFLTDIAFWFYNRKAGDILGFCEMEWRDDELLQMQRRMFEGQGIDTWEGHDDDVPVTRESGQRF